MSPLAILPDFLTAYSSGISDAFEMRIFFSFEELLSSVPKLRWVRPRSIVLRQVVQRRTTSREGTSRGGRSTESDGGEHRSRIVILPSCFRTIPSTGVLTPDGCRKIYSAA